eukprot:gb/GECG01003147.1/.p1 GENE.gb/GECG01003147.1/~~gb/GECG01003147.1/.p1  ORF type:complete len:339 (+),score=61.14 gb/GECG01003147.1/:1-1017(+)
MGKKTQKSKKAATAAPASTASNAVRTQSEPANASSTTFQNVNTTTGAKWASKKSKGRRRPSSTDSTSQTEARQYPPKAFTKLLHAPIVLTSQKRIVHTFLKASTEDKDGRTLIAHWLEFKFPEAAAAKSSRSFAPLSDDDLSELFKPAGSVTSIRRLGNDDKQTGDELGNKDSPEDMKYASALLQFTSQKELSRALRLRCRNGVFESLGLEPRGYNKWVADYWASRPDPDTLQAEVDEYMKTFEIKEKESEEEKKRMAQQPDEEGFVTVTSKKRTPTVADEQSSNMKRKRKRGSLEKPNFYRFQLREQKKSELDALQEKFEEDKAKIARIKAARKFKP